MGRANSPDRQIRSLVLYVDLVGSRRIWPAHVGRVVDRVGSNRTPSDRLDDQADDQAGQAARLVEPNWRLVLNPQAIDREVKRHGNAP
jgi:hypothetical protein